MSTLPPTPNLVRFNHLTPSTPRWLWPSRLPIGALTLLTGDPDVGKSLVALDLAARITTASPWPDTPQTSTSDSPDNAQRPAAPQKPADVLYLGSRFDFESVTLPRLISAGADPARFAAIESITPANADPSDPAPIPFRLHHHLPTLRDALRSCDNPALILIDSLWDYLPVCMSPDAFRLAVDGITRLAHEFNVAALAICHFNKQLTSRALYRSAGSLALVTAARCVHLIARDPNNPSNNLLLTLKNNFAPAARGLAFSHQNNRIYWLPGLPAPISPDQALTVLSAPRLQRVRVHHVATDFLKRLLAAAPMRSKEVFAAAQARALSHSIVREAATDLNVDVKKAGQNGPWMWRLPSTPAEKPPTDPYNIDESIDDILNEPDFPTPKKPERRKDEPGKPTKPHLFFPIFTISATIVARHCDKRASASPQQAFLSRPITDADRRMLNWWKRTRPSPVPRLARDSAPAPLILRPRPAPDIDVTDLLRRPAVNLDTLELQRFLAGKTILVTGAGGSIGSEICRQIMRFCPATLVLVEQAENNLFEIDRELREKWLGASIVPYVADICDAKRIRKIFAAHEPQVVLHCAAHKHVPMMEINPGEAIKNNVFGTKVVADAAAEARTDAFVMVSTDKAVNPTSVMGAAKRVAELYIQAKNNSPKGNSVPTTNYQLSTSSPTRFLAVRFGNVLGSSGSVVPIFKKQIAAGGPVTVTHPDMKRYFMTIPEASQLVLQAGAIGNGGEIFVLDMGEPIRIVDLARELIERSGLRVTEDIAIEFTGVRPGEKLYEELAGHEEETRPTSHSKIRVWQLPPANPQEFDAALKTLAAAVDGSPADAIAALKLCVPEYHPAGESPDDDPSAQRRLNEQTSDTEPIEVEAAAEAQAA